MEFILILSNLILLALILTCRKSESNKKEGSDQRSVHFRIDEGNSDISPINQEEMIELFKSKELDFENELDKQKQYYESLLVARKERDSEYDFIVSRYHNEANLRRTLENKNTWLIKGVCDLNTRLRLANKINRKLKNRHRIS